MSLTLRSLLFASTAVFVVLDSMLALADNFAIAALDHLPVPAFSLKAEEPLPTPDPILVVEGNLAITNVTLIDVEAGVSRPGMTVVIRGERIAAIGPAATTRAADGATLVDGTGKFLIPGLWDMHSHLVEPALPDIYLKYGVTGIRHMMSVNPYYQPKRPPSSIGPIWPRVVAANQALDGSKSGFGWPANKNLFSGYDADSARLAVREIRSRGNDFVKVYSALPREAYFAAVAEAKVYGLPVVGHVPYSVSAAEASDAGQRTIEHLDQVVIGCSSMEERLTGMLRQTNGPTGKLAGGARWRLQVDGYDSYDQGKADALFQKFVANGTWHVPTLVQTRAMTRLVDDAVLDPEIAKQLPPLVAMSWQREVTPGGVRFPNLGLKLDWAEVADATTIFRGDLQIVRQMHRAGVPLLAGTDAPAPMVIPGLALHEELALFVDAGMTPAEALRTATFNPARCLNREKDLGTVEAGKLADMVLLTRNPLDDIHNTRSVADVLVGGRVVGPNAMSNLQAANRVSRSGSSTHVENRR